MDITKKQIKQNREKWLKVLRDNKSRKYFFSLEDGTNRNARSILGHACHALGEKKKRIEVGHGLKITCYGLDKSGQFCPDSVFEKLDITETGAFRNPVYVNGGGYFDSIQDLFYGNLISLKEIADIIEREFKKDNFISYIPF